MKSGFFRTVLFGAAVLSAAPVLAQDVRTFEAPDGTYAFDYPLNFGLDHEFADGTGDVIGVTASSMNNGDVSIGLYPMKELSAPEISEETRQAVVNQFTKIVAVLPTIKFQSAAMTSMLGQPALDMVFENRRYGTPSVDRFIVAIRDGKQYSLNCIYRVDKTAEFAPACEQAAATVRLTVTDQAEDGSQEAKAAARAKGGACDKLELNRRAAAVTDLSDALMMKDQSPEMIARLQAAHQKMMAIDEQAGSNPSTQDCADMDAVAETLK